MDEENETNKWVEAMSESIRCSMEEIQKCIEEMEWQPLLTLFPNEFGAVEGGDPRSQVLLYLSWLLTDLFDAHWGDFTPLEIAKLLRDIADAITDCTESG